MRIVRSTLVHDPQRSRMVRQLMEAGRAVISGARDAISSLVRSIRRSSLGIREPSWLRIFAIISGTMACSSALLIRAGIETIIRPPWRYAEIFRFRLAERMTIISPSEMPGRVNSFSSTSSKDTDEKYSSNSQNGFISVKSHVRVERFAGKLLCTTTQITGVSNLYLFDSRQIWS